jgi:hypothetical protein
MQIAIMYLTVFAGAGTMFVFCSFWVYHYVQLDLDADGTGYYNGMENDGSPALGVVLTPFTEEAGGEGPPNSKMGRRHTSQY